MTNPKTPAPAKQTEFFIVQYDFGDKYETYADIAKGKRRLEECEEFSVAAKGFHVVPASRLREAEGLIERIEQHLKSTHWNCNDFRADSLELIADYRRKMESK